jgi:hypothetical protein
MSSVIANKRSAFRKISIIFLLLGLSNLWTDDCDLKRIKQLGWLYKKKKQGSGLLIYLYLGDNGIYK